MFVSSEFVFLWGLSLLGLSLLGLSLWGLSSLGFVSLGFVLSWVCPSWVCPGTQKPTPNLSEVSETSDNENGSMSEDEPDSDNNSHVNCFPY